MNEIIIIFLLLVFGSLLIFLLKKDINLVENLSLGFMTGLGLITYLMFIYSWFGIRITYNSTVLVILSLILLLLFILRKSLKNILLMFFDRSIFRDNSNKKNNYKFGLILSVLIILIVASTFIFAIYYPITVWDALALYDFRAKVIADVGYFVQISKNFTYFSHYPLFTSLSHTIIYLADGNNPQFLYPIYLVCFASLFYVLLKNKIGKLYSLASVLILVTMPEIFEHSTIAYTNLPYTVYYVISIIYLSIAMSNKEDKYFILPGILMGLSTWVRSDLPFWITGIVFSIFYAFKNKRIKPILFFVLPLLAIQQPWNYFASSLFGSDYSTSGQILSATGLLFKLFDMQRILEVCLYLYENVILVWGPLFVMFAFAILINFSDKKYSKSKNLLYLIIFNLIILFVGTYVFSFKVAEWKEIADSATRMSMFLVPLLVYYSSIVLFKYLGRGNKK